MQQVTQRYNRDKCDNCDKPDWKDINRVRGNTEMTQVEQLAAFVVRTTYENLSNGASRELKIRVLDALGCAIGALDGPPIKMLQAQLEDFGGNPLVTLIGGGKSAPDRAALYNSALVRYLDYNDSYLAKGETCHPIPIRPGGHPGTKSIPSIASEGDRAYRDRDL